MLEGKEILQGGGERACGHCTAKGHPQERHQKPRRGKAGHGAAVPCSAPQPLGFRGLRPRRLRLDAGTRLPQKSKGVKSPKSQSKSSLMPSPSSRPKW